MTLIYAILFASLLTLTFYLIKVLIKRRIQTNNQAQDRVSIKELDKILWPIFSKYVRSKDADWRGWVKCFTCSVTDEWKYFDAGHCIAKASTGSFLKYEPRQVKPQCKTCNQGKGGMRKEFEAGLKRLYGENIIQELKRYTEASLTISDYKQLIDKYTNLLKNLK